MFLSSLQTWFLLHSNFLLLVQNLLGLRLLKTSIYVLGSSSKRLGVNGVLRIRILLINMNHLFLLLLGSLFVFHHNLAIRWNVVCSWINGCFRALNALPILHLFLLVLFFHLFRLLMQREELHDFLLCLFFPVYVFIFFLYIFFWITPLCILDIFSYKPEFLASSSNKSNTFKSIFSCVKSNTMLLCSNTRYFFLVVVYLCIFFFFNSIFMFIFNFFFLLYFFRSPLIIPLNGFLKARLFRAILMVTIVIFYSFFYFFILFCFLFIFK